METQPLFLHQGLTDPEHQIRLLRIDSVLDNGTISCDLNAYYLDSAPPYAAISYTWGSPAPKKAILIDGKAFNVWSNAYDAMIQCHGFLKTADSPFSNYFWIDSVCINQTDLAEKSSQVAHMLSIFRAVAVVLAALGPHERDSELLFDFLGSFTETSQALSAHEIGSAADEVARVRAQETAETRLRALEHGQDFHRLCKSFRTFGERPYWSRMWIVQELLAGNHAFVMCGRHAVPLKTVSTFNLALSTTQTHRLRATLLLYPPMTTVLQAAMSMTVGPSSQQQNWTISFRHALSSFWVYGCSDPRDRIYGLLGLLSDEGIRRPFVKPDYGKSTLRLAAEILELLSSNDFKIVGRVIGALSLYDTDPPVSVLLKRRLRTSRSALGYDCQRIGSPAVQRIAPLYVAFGLSCTGAAETSLRMHGVNGTLATSVEWPQHALSEARICSAVEIVTGKTSFGFACSQTQPGDFLVPLLEERDNIRDTPLLKTKALILRSNRLPTEKEVAGPSEFGCLLEIIGQAWVHTGALEELMRKRQELLSHVYKVRADQANEEGQRYNCLVE